MNAGLPCNVMASVKHHAASLYVPAIIACLPANIMLATKIWLACLCAAVRLPHSLFPFFQKAKESFLIFPIDKASQESRKSSANVRYKSVNVGRIIIP